MKKIFHKAGEGSGLFVEAGTEKTLAQVKKEHGSGTWQELTIDETAEGYTLDKDGKLTAYSLGEERQQKEVEKETKRQLLRDELKSKLSLNDEQLEILKKAIREGI